MCDDNMCNMECYIDEDDIYSSIERLQKKIDELEEEVKYLKEDMRDIQKGHSKSVNNVIESRIDNAVNSSYRDLQRDINNLETDYHDLKFRVETLESK